MANYSIIDLIEAIWHNYYIISDDLTAIIIKVYTPVCLISSVGENIVDEKPT